MQYVGILIGYSVTLRGSNAKKFGNLVKKIFYLIGSIKQLRIKFGIDNKTFNMFLKDFWWNFELTARYIPGN